MSQGNEFFEFAPSDRNHLLQTATHASQSKSLMASHGARTAKTKEADDSAVTQGNTSFLHKLPFNSESGQGRFKGAANGTKKTSYGGGFTFASSREYSDEHRDSLNPLSAVASSYQSAKVNRRMIESSQSAQRTIGALSGGTVSPQGLLPTSVPSRVNTANVHVMDGGRLKQIRNRVTLDLANSEASSPKNPQINL